MRTRIPLILAAFVAALLAGCIGASPSDLVGASDPAPDVDANASAQLTTERFDAIVYEELHVEADDGTEINVDLWRPDTDSGPADAADWEAPVILVYSPYFGFQKDPTGRDPGPYEGSFYDWMIDHFTARGYAVALADVRGTRESGGCIDVAGPQEVAAGARTVEALASEDWSNGKVGMFGVSYPARTQYGVATLDPAGLETIVPVAGISDYYSYFYYQGVPREGNNPGTIAGYTAISLIPHPSEDGVTAYPDRPRCWADQTAHAADLSGEWDGFWEARDYNSEADQVTASVWMIHGFEDWNVIPRSAIDYFDAVDAPKKAWLLQMEHNYPHYNTHEPDWSRQDFKEKLHEWYDAELLDRDVGAHAGAAVKVQDSSGQWRETETWPPEDATPRTFQLGADGSLEEGLASGGTRTYVAPTEHDGRDTYLEGDTQIVYESTPLEEDLHIAGWPELELTASIEGESTHVMWHLEAVPPGDDEATLVTRGYLDTLYRDGVEEGPEPMERDEVEPLELTAHPQDDVIPAGHTLRLTITGDDYWMHSDTSETAAASVTVHHGTSPSQLVLPAVDPPEDAYFHPPMGPPE